MWNTMRLKIVLKMGAASWVLLFLRWSLLGVLEQRVCVANAKKAAQEADENDADDAEDLFDAYQLLKKELKEQKKK